MRTGLPAERRAARLLRWYPRAWRARYGEEFTELLLAEIAEVPRSWRRVTDVIFNAMVQRLTSVGLTGHRADPADQIRASLATLGCALAALVTFGLAMLAQLDIGWQWATPRAGATASGMAIMTGAVERVRPKMMTVTAIIAGLLPILWSHGTGSELMQRIAVPMIGGMVSSTVLTLIVIPAVYGLVKGWGMERARRHTPAPVSRPAE